MPSTTGTTGTPGQGNMPHSETQKSAGMEPPSCPQQTTGTVDLNAQPGEQRQGSSQLSSPDQKQVPSYDGNVGSGASQERGRPY